MQLTRFRLLILLDLDDQSRGTLQTFKHLNVSPIDFAPF